MDEYTDEQLQEISGTPTQKLRSQHNAQQRIRKLSLPVAFLMIGVLLISVLVVILYPLLIQAQASHQLAPVHHPVATSKPKPTPTPFDPSVGAVLPNRRVVAFYGIPNAEATGPAFELNASMLKHLQTQGAAYQKLDPAHPVQLGIDLVASIPDGSPGPKGTYSHHLDPDIIQSYIQFCQKHDLILFLDLDFGLASVKSEVQFFLPYLERYSFVHLAIDPEWMFPRHNGIPGIDLSNVRASDLNPIIEAVAELPMKYHVPRKILLIHQYRGDGDNLKNPYDPGQAEIADKRHLLNDPRVDVVIAIDGVGGYVGDQTDKIRLYNNWVGKAMQTYHNFSYGGFKLFYHIEAKTLMTPKQVLALDPSPLVITYGN